MKKLFALVLFVLLVAAIYAYGLPTVLAFLIGPWGLVLGLALFGIFLIWNSLAFLAMKRSTKVIHQKIQEENKEIKEQQRFINRVELHEREDLAEQLGSGSGPLRNRK